MKERFPKDSHNLNRSDQVRISHNTPEHKMEQHDWFDDIVELHTCPTCKTEFHGCRSRLNCYKCMMEGSISVKEIRQ